MSLFSEASPPLIYSNAVVVEPLLAENDGVYPDC